MTYTVRTPQFDRRFAFLEEARGFARGLRRIGYSTTILAGDGGIVRLEEAFRAEDDWKLWDPQDPPAQATKRPPTLAEYDRRR